VNGAVEVLGAEGRRAASAPGIALDLRRSLS
jgi:hypothetical protein